MEISQIIIYTPSLILALNSLRCQGLLPDSSSETSSPPALPPTPTPQLAFNGERAFADVETQIVKFPRKVAD